MRRRRLAAIALIVILLLPSAAAAGGPLIAQSMWGTKGMIQIDKLWWLGRAPWSERVTGEGIRVAIVDTGMDPSHPDLGDSVVAWKDFVGDAKGVRRDSAYDDHGHGTHVAGIVAARGHAQWNPLHYYWLSGMRGVAPGADLMVAKAINSRGFGTDESVAAAILWAMDPNGDGDLADGCHIINLSIGIERPSETSANKAFVVGSETKRAVQLALARGIVVVASSGNEAKEMVAEPGDIPGVISVGATDREGNVAEFSNSGQLVDLVAPGVLVSAFPKILDTGDFAQDGYVGMAGTSMAAPIVSSVVALMMAADPTLAERSTVKNMNGKIELIQSTLKETASEIKGEGVLRGGAGLVNANAAVLAVDVGTSDLDWTFIGVTGVSAAAGAALVIIPQRKAKRRAAEALEIE